MFNSLELQAKYDKTVYFYLIPGKLNWPSLKVKAKRSLRNYHGANLSNDIQGTLTWANSLSLLCSVNPVLGMAKAYQSKVQATEQLQDLMMKTTQHNTLLTAHASQASATTVSRSPFSCFRALSPWCPWDFMKDSRVSVTDLSKLTRTTAALPTPIPVRLPQADSHRPLTCNKQPCSTSLAAKRLLVKVPLLKVKQKYFCKISILLAQTGAYSLHALL